VHPVRVASLVEDVTVAVAPLDTIRLRASVPSTARTTLPDFAVTLSALVLLVLLLLSGVAALLAVPASVRAAGRSFGPRAPPRARHA
jgi:hypothetical protein